MNGVEDFRELVFDIKDCMLSNNKTKIKCDDIGFQDTSVSITRGGNIEILITGNSFIHAEKVRNYIILKDSITVYTRDWDEDGNESVLETNCKEIGELTANYLFIELTCIKNHLVKEFPEYW